ncbi:hypothetical protein POM88_045536 [Heracleum sosnowskyi]|uniref:Uncharacterized protein n=1 Tax=Heracleum sosnowskyi TaxID=360622 RepID=A0AAD8H7N3_9APIA|nr:hypothetical protein POM88_045536 [Heracleum sosnowskyi]
MTGKRVVSARGFTSGSGSGGREAVVGAAVVRGSDDGGSGGNDGSPGYSFGLFILNCVGVKEIDRKSPKFWDDRIDEFLQYYISDPKFAIKDEARASIAVLHDKLRRALVDDKKKADAQKKARETYAQHMPLYMKPGVWSKITKYWESEEFKKKSEAGKKARKAVKLPHTPGARSFDRRRRVIDRHVFL